MKRSGFHRTDFKLVKEGTCAREDTPQETPGSGPELPAGSSTHSVRTGKPEPQSWKDGRPSRVPFQDFACMETEVQAVISRAAVLGEEGLALPEVLETLTGVLGEQSRAEHKAPLGRLGDASTDKACCSKKKSSRSFEKCYSWLKIELKLYWCF